MWIHNNYTKCIYNSFTERKKLKLSAEKCSRINVGKKINKSDCVAVRVHSEEMKDSGQTVHTKLLDGGELVVPK